MSKKYIGIIILLTCSFLLLPQNTYSSSDKEDYELQEKCGKSCDEYFSKERQITPRETTMGYNCHYNKKLNKCFIVTSYNVPFPDMELLHDVNENKQYGGIYFPRKNIVDCSFLDKKCQSKEEWDLFVKPYMEE